MLIAVFTGSASVLCTHTKAHLLFALEQGRDVFLFSLSCWFVCSWLQVWEVKNEFTQKVHTRTRTYRRAHTEKHTQGREVRGVEWKSTSAYLSGFMLLILLHHVNQSNRFRPNKEWKCAQPNLKISSHSDTTYLHLLVFLLRVASSVFLCTHQISLHSVFTFRPHCSPCDDPLTHAQWYPPGERGSPTLRALPETPLSGDSGKRGLMLPLSLPLSLSWWRGCQAVALDRLSLNI